jgi:hypothetical protein
MENNNIKVKIKKIQDISNPDSLRYELYAIFVSLLLSKEAFKNNKEINVFMNLFGITFKEYIMKSRTQIMAKTIRLLEKADVSSLESYKGILNNIYVSNNQNNSFETKEKKQPSDNYMNNILNKYSRNKG